MFLNPFAPREMPGSLTIPDLGSARIPRAVLRTAYGPATRTALGIRGETNLGKLTITSFWNASTRITT